jgi:DNA-binding transcriptional regulator YiaG
VTRAQLAALLGGDRAAGRELRFFAVDLVRTARNAGTNDDGRDTRPRSRMTLRALRQGVGRTQGEIARRVSMTQPQLSRVEARRDHLTSTLRRYVQALGGEMEVVARVGGMTVILKDV